MVTTQGAKTSTKGMLSSGIVDFGDSKGFAICLQNALWGIVV
jgi:hypothetical protein